MIAESTCEEYNVLFYKRSHSKVHKSKGVSKIDGVLTINTQSHVVSLRCLESDDSSEDDAYGDQHSNKSTKKTWKQRKTSKTTPRGLMFSGKPNNDIIDKGIQLDTTIVIGSYDVEIVSSRLAPDTFPEANPLVQSTKATKQVFSENPGLSKQPVTRPTVTNSCNTLLPVKRKSIVQTSIQRRPPPQPRKHAPSQSSQAPQLESIASTKLPIDPMKEEDSPNLPVVLASKGSLSNSTDQKKRLLVQNSPPKWTAPFTNSDAAVLAHIPLPAAVRNVLRPHQVSGIDFLWKALTEQKGAILADEMGLGKTLMSIALITAWHRQQRSHSHIVVCPSSLVRNWEQEFNKWLGKASQPKRMVIRQGGAEGLQKIRAFATNQSKNRSNRVGQVLLVSYDLFRMHTSVLQQSVEGAIGLLMVDEGHRLKNTSSSLTMTALESLPSHSRLLITASPVQNNLSEFYSLVQFVRPGLLGDLSTFRKEFERPISAANRKNATAADRQLALQQSRELESLTRTTILRRLQSEVLASVLPPRTEILLFCRLSEEQRHMYLSLTSERLKKLSGPSNSIADALETLTDLRKICTHPSLICKSKKSAVAEALGIEASGKLGVLSILLHAIRQSGNDDKVVIVSNFTTALSLIENLILKPGNLSYLRLDGSVSAQSRQDLVDTFNQSSPQRSFVFLLSAKAGGCGLNLVSANRLVMFDPADNPAIDLQAMGRIYRTGQRRATTIYRLFSTGTVEEIIYQRQLQKGVLASATVDGREDQKASFTPDELKESMKLKSGTICDTKDKIGCWPDYDPISLSKINDIDTPLLRASESALVSFVHVVDKSVVEQSRQAQFDGNACDDSDNETYCEPIFEGCTLPDSSDSSGSDAEFEFS